MKKKLLKIGAIFLLIEMVLNLNISIASSITYEINKISVHYNVVGLIIYFLYLASMGGFVFFVILNTIY